MGLSESRNKYDLPSLVSLPNVLSEAQTRETSAGTVERGLTHYCVLQSYEIPRCIHRLPTTATKIEFGLMPGGRWVGVH